MYAYPDWEFPENNFEEERSDVYWAGWALAEYQWFTCKRYKDVFSRIPFSEIVSMYSVHHEMDIEHFIAAKEKDGAEQMLPELSSEIQSVYRQTKEGNGQRWLMIDLEDEGEIFEDILRLIVLRV